MIKKDEAISFLIDTGELTPKEVNELSWVDLRTKYYEIKNRSKNFGPIDQEYVDVKLERKLSLNEIKEQELKEEREILKPQIKEFIKSMKGKINISQQEMKLMFSLYNRYYKRNDGPGCSVCVARVYNALKNIK